MEKQRTAVIIGGGPAGLFAASQLTGKGINVELYEKMLSPGRKFLLAGQSGLNLTNDEDPRLMAGRYGRHRDLFLSLLMDLSPEDTRSWFRRLGVETFRGNGGKIFPMEDMPVKRILNLWLNSLRDTGLFRLHEGWDWLGWRDEGLLLVKDNSEYLIKDRPVLFALGGASWPTTGSDGAWGDYMRAKDIRINQFKAMNCGFHVDWSALVRERHKDEPVKGIALVMGDERKRGDLLITRSGLEGSPLYWFSLKLREQLEEKGWSEIAMDLTPDLSREKVKGILDGRPRKKSLPSYLVTKGLLSPVKKTLLWEFTSPEERQNTDLLAGRIKKLPVKFTGINDMKRAISSSGGIDLGELDENLMIRKLPGYFASGEMLDWEAPTGGYMLQGCFASSYRAARGMVSWLG